MLERDGHDWTVVAFAFTGNRLIEIKKAARAIVKAASVQQALALGCGLMTIALRLRSASKTL